MGRQDCPLDPLLTWQPCLPAALKQFGNQICWQGRGENHRVESLLGRHLYLDKFQPNPLPTTSVWGVRSGLQEWPHPFPLGQSLPGQSHSARNQAASTADSGRFPSEGRKASPLGESCAGEAEARVKANEAARKLSLFPEMAKWSVAFQHLLKESGWGWSPIRAFH